MEAQTDRLLFISKKEGINIEKDALNELVSVSGGDLRKSITLLQSMSSLECITVPYVNEASGFIPVVELDTLIRAAKSQKREQLGSAVHGFTRQGYSVYQLIQQLSDVLLNDEQIHVLQLVPIIEKMAECEKRLIDGADEFLQLYDLMSIIMNSFFESDCH